MERLFLLCSGLLVTTVTSQHNVCSRPELQGNINMTGIQRFFSPGVELALSCKQGYTPVSGPRKIVCTMNGVWTNTKFNCIPKQCPYPELITNGELFYENTVYQSTINYTCHEGYTMTGSSSAVCQANGTWSTPAPECIRM
ncbi:hypothetical protein XENORESO_017637 [Xenotaenia resolanae]|uniref:Sushi domain-containing protein n=1 Tax=Xenotaenia resolanae TaxID=208358 RepID=A0ABV0VZW0_9TELE